MSDCPVCHSDTGVKIPREGSPYCEDCGWPDEDFGEEWGYPAMGSRLEQYQPGLQFYDEKRGKWVPSGIISATMKEHFRGFYRYKIRDAGGDV